MEDTDWRPSPCPVCGVLRAAVKYPKCHNKECEIGESSTIDKLKETRTMKTEHRYIWHKKGQPLEMIDDVEWLYKRSDFDPDEDKIYELGPEVKLEVNVKVVPAKREYRGERSYTEGTR
jgi:hypothetical protein